jgi:hypothetical protein
MDVATAERLSYAVARLGQIWGLGLIALFAYHRAWPLAVLMVLGIAFFEYSVRREIQLPGECEP